MEIKNLVIEIDQNIARLREARKALTSDPEPAAKVVTMTPEHRAETHRKVNRGMKGKTLSAEAKKKISDAQKQRWAERRKADTKGEQKAA